MSKEDLRRQIVMDPSLSSREREQILRELDMAWLHGGQELVSDVHRLVAIGLGALAGYLYGRGMNRIAQTAFAGLGGWLGSKLF
jgi:hypothetical protein